MIGLLANRYALFDVFVDLGAPHSGSLPDRNLELMSELRSGYGFGCVPNAEYHATRKPPSINALPPAPVLRAHVPCIVLQGTKEQMARIDAPRDIAVMTDEHSCGDGASENRPSNSVSTCLFTAHRQLPVFPIDGRTKPYPAPRFSDSFDVAFKPNLGVFSIELPGVTASSVQRVSLTEKRRTLDAGRGKTFNVSN